jgi:protein-S-isoprenylcysteine O-methyltransferase Ste14
MICVIASYIYRVRVEEKALSDTIGEPYIAFMKTRRRFIPYVI